MVVFLWCFCLWYWCIMFWWCCVCGVVRSRSLNIFLEWCRVKFGVRDFLNWMWDLIWFCCGYVLFEMVIVMLLMGRRFGCFIWCLWVIVFCWYVLILMFRSIGGLFILLWIWDFWVLKFGWFDNWMVKWSLLSFFLVMYVFWLKIGLV